VHRGDEQPGDAELLIQHLRHGRQGVGGARGHRNHIVTGALVRFPIDAEHDGHVGIARWCTDDHLAGTRLKMLRRSVAPTKSPGGFDDDVHFQRTPRNLGGFLLAEEARLSARDADRLLVVRYVCAQKAVNGVVLEQVGQLVEGRQIVDRDDLYLRHFQRPADHHAADASESIDADATCHSSLLSCGGDRHLAGDVRGVRSCGASVRSS
jgi:hypothetical protein